MWQLTGRQEGLWAGGYLVGLIGASIILTLVDASSSAIEAGLMAWTFAWAAACWIWQSVRFNRWWRTCRRNPIVRPD